MGSRTGVANLPLHHGRAPRWLFQRMVSLARGVVEVVVEEAGPQEMLARLSDPLWFQAFGCLLGFDWHSSGVTTTVCGALKEAVRGSECDLGLAVAGGKGAASRKTPAELERLGDRWGLDASPLVSASRMTAKVDSAGLQDGYQLYHHSFLVTASGQWAVVQQGMNETTRYARRYHWRGDTVVSFVCDPHAAIASQGRGAALNMVAAGGEESRTATTFASGQPPERILSDLRRLKELSLPRRHEVLLSDIHPENLHKTLLITYERQPVDFAQLLGLPGVGAKTVRALALVADLVYGAAPSYEDPATYGFAHGGKDGYPYPVDREIYDRSIEVLRRAASQAKLGRTEKVEALKRLAGLVA